MSGSGRELPCPACGFDLRATPSAACPECGDDAVEFRLPSRRPTRRERATIALDRLDFGVTFVGFFVMVFVLPFAAVSGVGLGIVIVALTLFMVLVPAATAVLDVGRVALDDLPHFVRHQYPRHIRPRRRFGVFPSRRLAVLHLTLCGMTAGIAVCMCVLVAFGFDTRPVIWIGWIGALALLGSRATLMLAVATLTRIRPAKPVRACVIAFVIAGAAIPLPFLFAGPATGDVVARLLITSAWVAAFVAMLAWWRTTSWLRVAVKSMPVLGESP